MFDLLVYTIAQTLDMAVTGLGVLGLGYPEGNPWMVDVLDRFGTGGLFITWANNEAWAIQHFFINTSHVQNMALAHLLFVINWVIRIVLGYFGIEGII